jgi:acetyl-CoA carboxylase biotin carboxyl carrier protein
MTSTKRKSSFDAETVRSLGQMLLDLSLSEIEYEDETLRVRVSRALTAAPAAVSMSPGLAAGEAASTPANTVEDLAAHPGLLTAPMVGVVYTSPEPGEPAFVKLGDTVAVGDTVLLIEAMKVFNPIKVHRAGRVSRIFVGNGVPVEFGEPLLLVD